MSKRVLGARSSVLLGLLAAWLSPTSVTAQAASPSSATATPATTVQPKPAVNRASPGSSASGDNVVKPSGSATPTASSPPALDWRPEPNQIETFPGAPPGTLEVLVLDAKAQPLPGIAVDLLQSRQSVADGDRSSAPRHFTTDSRGSVRVAGLSTQSENRYQLRLNAGGLTYGASTFVLDPLTGSRATLHAYPIVKSLDAALVAAQGFVFLEPKEESMTVEVLYNVFQLGPAVWIPLDVNVRLPLGAKAFNTRAMDEDLAVTSSDGLVRLVGAVTPGKHSVTFSFQLPLSGNESEALELGLLPNIAELKVAAALPKGASLEVAGYPETEPSSLESGQRVVVTGRSYEHDKAPPASLSLTVRGLPTPGPARWIATTAAAMLGFGALAYAVLRGRRGAAGELLSLRERARARVLQEAKAVEAAHQRGEIGPETHAEALERLMVALSRLDRAQ